MRDALDLYDLPFYNNSGEAIPPYAVMQVDNWKDDANNRDYFRVRKPNGSGKMFIVNGPLEVAAAGDGMGSRKEGIPARYLSGTPAPDEEWGPTSGSWYLSASGSGFNIVGGNETLNGATVTHVNLAGASSGNIIYAQVNKTSNVASGEPNFPFDNAQPVVGAIPSGGSGTAQNQYAQEYLDNEWVFLLENQLTGQWLTERGGSSGSQIVHFELTENKVYGDASALALPVLPNGDIDDEADEFYVVDELNQFFGRGPEDNDGYRGFAMRFSDDYSEGIPGFRIITMEGPAQWLIVTLNETASSTTECLFDGFNQPWGRPFRGRRLPPTGTVEVHDDLSVASGGQSGDKWLAAWDEADEQYIFVVPIKSASESVLVLGMVTATIGAATMNGSAITASPGITSAAVTKLQWDGADLEADGSAIHGVNFSKTPLRASTGEPLIVSGEIKTDIPDVEEAFIIHAIYDLRMLPGLSSSGVQVPYKPDSGVAFELDSEDCPE